MNAGSPLTNGAALGNNDFNVTINYNNGFSVDPTSGDFVPGFQSGTPFQAPGWDGPATANGTSSFTSTNGFLGTVNPGQNSNNFLVVRGYDLDGTPGFDPETDAPLAYTSSQTWTITPTNGFTKFGEGTQFTFSLDGAQFSNFDQVPEPSVFMLGAIGSLMFFSRRSRKTA